MKKQQAFLIIIRNDEIIKTVHLFALGSAKSHQSVNFNNIYNVFKCS